MEVIEAIAQVIGATIEGANGGKKANKWFYIVLILTVIGLFLFTLLMS